LRLVDNQWPGKIHDKEMNVVLLVSRKYIVEKTGEILCDLSFHANRIFGRGQPEAIGFPQFFSSLRSSFSFAAAVTTNKRITAAGKGI